MPVNFMKQNPFPNKNLLVIVTIGSTLLAIPGAFGGLFLVSAGFKELSDFGIFGLLIALPPVIGFSLLFGYYWTLFSHRIVKWFWIASFVFNLILTLSSVIFLFSILNELKGNSLFGSLIFLFPFWTAFVVYVSQRFAYAKKEGISINLP